jgi:hypothetical protein
MRATSVLPLFCLCRQQAEKYALPPPDTVHCCASCSFAPRHNSAHPGEVQDMVKQVGFESVDALIDATVPTAIRRDPMELGIYNQGFTESGIIAKLK